MDIVKNSVLWIDACLREDSRTRTLTQALLARLGEPYEVCRLYEEELPHLTQEGLEARTEASQRRDFSDPSFHFAKDFAQAEKIVISAPFWDLSFPAILKQYIEAITVNGLTFSYSPEGIPMGHCRAGVLYYVTTSGGPLLPDFGYRYIATLAGQMFGIPRVELLSAQMLDIQGADVPALLAEAEKGIDAIL